MKGQSLFALACHLSSLYLQSLKNLAHLQEQWGKEQQIRLWLKQVQNPRWICHSHLQATPWEYPLYPLKGLRTYCRNFGPAGRSGGDSLSKSTALISADRLNLLYWSLGNPIKAGSRSHTGWGQILACKFDLAQRLAILTCCFADVNTVEVTDHSESSVTGPANLSTMYPGKTIIRRLKASPTCSMES